VATENDLPTTVGKPSPSVKRRYRGPFLEMLISSVLSLTASLVLAIDAITLAKDPNAALSCNISSTISCAKVGVTWQANLLGFPNAFLGLIAEPVVITIAVAALGGVLFPRWFMNAAMVFYAIGLGFAYWLFAQAYFVIGAMCPWCLLITIATTTVFASMLRVNLSENTFRLPRRINEKIQLLLRLGVDVWITVLIVTIVLAMVIYRYV